MIKINLQNPYVNTWGQCFQSYKVILIKSFAQIMTNNLLKKNHLGDNKDKRRNS